MRYAGVLLVLSIGIAVVGCKNKGEADAAPDPAAVKAQADLVARRDAMLAARSKLKTERDTVVEEIKDTAAKGGDTTELETKKADLDSKLETSDTEMLGMLSSKL